MSRHTITAKNPMVCDAAAGWDRQTQTFFYQETKTFMCRGEEIDDTQIVIGGEPEVQLDADVFMARLSDFAHTPLGFRDQLLDDRDGVSR